MNAEPPVDPAAVTADDVLIDALSTAGFSANAEEVARLLAGWRREVRAQGVPEMVGTAEMATAMQIARRCLRRAEVARRRWRGIALALALVAPRDGRGRRAGYRLGRRAPRGVALPAAHTALRRCAVNVMEPSAAMRQAANQLRQTFVALVNEGFSEQQALIIIGQILAAQGGERQ